jgi:AraC-like DNA-binding protein
VLQSASLADALDALTQFHFLLCDDVNFRVHEQNGTVFVRSSRIAGASDRVQRLVAETLVIGLLRMLRAYRSEACIDCVTFDYPAPAYAAEYLRIFGPNVRFNQLATGLSFPRAQLQTASPFRDAEFHKTVKLFTERRLEQLTLSSTYASRVRELLLQAGSPRQTNMRDISSALGICERTLRRRLTEEGTSYDTLASESAAAVAKTWLLDKRRTIKETAAELGFGDRRAFHRAFRRWTGMTPATFRRNALAGDDR